MTEIAIEWFARGRAVQAGFWDESEFWTARLQHLRALAASHRGVFDAARDRIKTSDDDPSPLAVRNLFAQAFALATASEFAALARAVATRLYDLWQHWIGTIVRKLHENEELLRKLREIREVFEAADATSQRCWQMRTGAVFEMAILDDDDDDFARDVAVLAAELAGSSAGDYAELNKLHLQMDGPAALARLETAEQRRPRLFNSGASVGVSACEKDLFGRLIADAGVKYEPPELEDLQTLAKDPQLAFAFTRTYLLPFQIKLLEAFPIENVAKTRAVQALAEIVRIANEADDPQNAYRALLGFEAASTAITPEAASIAVVKANVPAVSTSFPSS